MRRFGYHSALILIWGGQQLGVLQSVSAFLFFLDFVILLLNIYNAFHIYTAAHFLALVFEVLYKKM